jgi:hypothetical protein
MLAALGPMLHLWLTRVCYPSYHPTPDNRQMLKNVRDPRLSQHSWIYDFNSALLQEILAFVIYMREYNLITIMPSTSHYFVCTPSTLQNSNCYINNKGIYPKWKVNSDIDQNRPKTSALRCCSMSTPSNGTYAKRLLYG